MSKKADLDKKIPKPTFGEDSNYLLHCCMLCQGLRKTLVNHHMFSCEMLKDLDNLESHDIGKYQAKFFSMRFSNDDKEKDQRSESPNLDLPDYPDDEEN